MKTIAIIGGGFRGVGCLKILLEQGYKVDLFEKNDDVGGVWHPSNNYKGLMIHTPAKLNQFFDFPYPKHIDLTERLKSKDVYEYLKSFSDHFNLYPHMTFNTSVSQINYKTKGKTSLTLSINGEEIESSEYDYVINTNGYCDRHIPDFNNSDKFKGEIIHSFEATEDKINEMIAQNKKITLLGAGKTACDLILSFEKSGYRPTWLYRKPYWFFRFNPLQNAIKHSMKGVGGDTFYKMMMLSGFLLAGYFPKAACKLWRKLNIIDTFGEKHDDYRKFHVALITDQEFETLKDINRTSSVVGEIDHFKEKSYVTQDGTEIEADVVICCTGSSGTKSPIPITVDGKLLDLKRIHKAYRASVIPEVPNLIFTAYHHFAMSLCDGELQARWIHNFIQSNLSPEYIKKHALSYDYPFFTKLILFDSSEYYFPSFMKMQHDFIDNHEMGKIEYVSFVYNFFFQSQMVKPIEMHPLKTATQP